MNPQSIKFVIFAAFGALCLAAGYTARRRKWVTEQASRPVHFWTVVAIWAPITLLAFWDLPLNRQLLLLFVMQLLTLLVGWAAAWTAAKLLRLSPVPTGVLILCAALSNQGFTMGAYLCYTLFDPPDQAMAYAIAYVTAMQVFMVLIFYPVARHYGPDERMPVARLMLRSFFDVRALPIHLGIVGVILSALGAPYPRAINQYGLLEVMIYLGAAGGFFGIGLRFHAGDMLRVWPMHAATAAVRFVIVPLAAWGLLIVFAQTSLAPTALTDRVLFVEAFMPTAINGVIISNLFHLDARLASTLWLGSTIAFLALVMPFLMVLVG